MCEVVPRWLSQIEESCKDETKIQDIIAAVTVDKSGPQEFYMKQSLLMYRG